MNIIRPEKNAILIWNLKMARTAYISGEELTSLMHWAMDTNNAFSNRLLKLGIVAEDSKQDVRKAILRSPSMKAPTDSFCAPESIHIELTEHCPLNCPMCYKTSTASELPLDYLLDIVRQASEMQVFQIALGGGEPLIYPHLLIAVREISSFKMASTITSSGVGLTTELVAELGDAGLNHVQISLNGSTKAVHSLSREGFDDGLMALNILRQSGLSYGINWVARMDNIDDFPAVTELALNYKADNLNILRYKPSPKEEYDQVALSAEKTLLLEEFIKNTKGVRIRVDSAYSNLRCKLNNQTSFMSGCGAGRRFLSVSACGSYMPCSHVCLKEKAENLQHVWHHSKNMAMFRNLSKNLTEPCASCTYLKGCYGCRAIVFPLESDFNAGDKDCVFWRNIVENKLY